MGLLAEGDQIAADNKGERTINAALISAGQKVEHHEIASYGCLREWAGLLGKKDAVKELQRILDEEEAANETLVKLARAGSNQEALCAGNEKDSSVKSNGSALGRGMRPTKPFRKPAATLA